MATSVTTSKSVFNFQAFVPHLFAAIDMVIGIFHPGFKLSGLDQAIVIGLAPLASAITAHGFLSNLLGINASTTKSDIEKLLLEALNATQKA